MRIRGADRARWRQTPAGTRDQLAGEVAARRRLEARLRETFARWGYEEVTTPTLEHLETLLHGAGPGLGDRLLKLVDAGGEVLTLRPEMTVPLARLAATRLLPAGRVPLRLAYVAAVFRGQERGSGREREFTQAGVELIGDGGLYADVEAIALAADALRVAEVEEPAISVGHAGFLRGLLAELPPQTAEAVRDLLYRRAFAELGSVLPPGPVLSALRVVPTLQGPDALSRARPLAANAESAEALDRLRLVLDGVAAHDLPVAIHLNLGLIRDFEYYSGTVFEGHARGAGMPLLGGGRYDGLLARFGLPAPATGFAIGVERILDAVRPASALPPVVAVRCGAGRYAEAVRVAGGLRAAGVGTVVVVEGPAPPDGVEVVLDADGVRVRGRHGEVRASAGDLLDAVRRAFEAP